MKCKVCEDEFVPKNKAHIYCSPYCRGRSRELGDERRIKMNKYRADWKERNASTVYTNYRDNHLKKNFGITLQQYDEILTKQGGGCAICDKTPEQEGRSLAVDHDHQTGEIFGILCYFCNNKVLGKKRNPALFQRASEYLQKGTGYFVPIDKNRTRRRKRKKLVKSQDV